MTGTDSSLTENYMQNPVPEKHGDLPGALALGQGENLPHTTFLEHALTIRYTISNGNKDLLLFLHLLLFGANTCRHACR